MKVQCTRLEGLIVIQYHNLELHNQCVNSQHYVIHGFVDTNFFDTNDLVMYSKSLIFSIPTFLIPRHKYLCWYL